MPSNSLNFENFDTRHYETVTPREGYGMWAPTYEDTVEDLMDLRLLERLSTVPWRECGRVMDLACGTGRIGAWLRAAGVGQVEGHDLTPQMADLAKAKGVYETITLGDIGATGREDAAYDLVTTSLVCEHLPSIEPMYREAARLLRSDGRFVIVGYHPHFLLMGIPTHFDRADGTPLAIDCHIHLTSDHVTVGLSSGFTLTEMTEGVIDEAWATVKPKWVARHGGRPVTYAMVWRKVV